MSKEVCIEQSFTKHVSACLQELVTKTSKNIDCWTGGTRICEWTESYITCNNLSHTKIIDIPNWIEDILILTLTSWIFDLRPPFNCGARAFSPFALWEISPCLNTSSAFFVTNVFFQSSMSDPLKWSCCRHACFVVWSLQSNSTYLP